MIVGAFACHSEGAPFGTPRVPQDPERQRPKNLLCGFFPPHSGQAARGVPESTGFARFRARQAGPHPIRQDAGRAHRIALAEDTHNAAAGGAACPGHRTMRCGVSEPMVWAVGNMLWRIGALTAIEEQVAWVREAGFRGVGLTRAVK